MKTNFEKVRDFNNCFGHVVHETHYNNVFDEDPKLVELRLNLINEEINELKEAYENDDIVEIIDALSDILYVGYGLCVCFGINIDNEYSKFMIDYHRVLKNNLSITEEDFSNQTNFEKTQTIISIQSDVKNYKKNIENKMYKINLNMIMSFLDKSFVELKQSCDKKNFKEVIYNIYNVLKNTYLCGIHIGCDLNQSFKIVHDSNMTKICDNEELAKKTVQNYIDNDQRYDSPSYKQNEFGYVIYNQSTNKILKSLNYNVANFDSILN